MRSLGHAILVSLTVVCHTTSADFVAPVYSVYLDEPAQERWQVVMLETIALHGWEHSYQPIFDFINSVFPKQVWSKFDQELRDVAEPIIGEEATKEIEGIVQVAHNIGHNVTRSELEFFQLFYEILMECTGILARDDHGHIIHGRNMDIGLPVQNVTAQIEWKRKRGDKALVTSTQYLGYVGVHTGMRINGWSVQANERVVLSPGPVVGYQPAILLETVAAFLEGHTPVGNFLRNILLTTATYEEALPLLINTKLASPMYLIVGGLHNGTVLTRDRMGLATESMDTSFFGRQKVPAVNGAMRNVSRMQSGWWEVQTNWDPWINETHKQCDERMAKMTKVEEEHCDDYLVLFYGDNSRHCDDLCQLYSDGRAEHARKGMRTLADQREPIPTIWKVLSTDPVLNGGTKFTSVMSASKGLYKTLVREPMGDQTPKEDVFESLRFFVRSLARIPGL